PAAKGSTTIITRPPRPRASHSVALNWTRVGGWCGCWSRYASRTSVTTTCTSSPRPEQQEPLARQRADDVTQLGRAAEQCRRRCRDTVLHVPQDVLAARLGLAPHQQLVHDVVGNRLGS